MLSELTLTVMRLGLLVLMWFFVFAVVGVLRGDLYGTRVKRRASRHRQGRRARSPPRRRTVPPARRTRRPPAAARARPSSPSPRARWPAPRCRCARPAPSSAAAPSARSCSTTTTRRGRHARIFQDDDGTWKVEDLRSTNGTFLGATRLTEPREVAVGSVLRIGQTVVELQR